MIWDPLILCLLALTGCAAGFIDAIAGGGGIITVPVLLMTGMPAPAVLATNKLQSTCGSCMAFFSYRRGGLVAIRRSWTGMLWTALGATLGVLAIDALSPDRLRGIIVVLLCVIFLWLLARPRYGSQAGCSRWSRPWFFLVFGLSLGAYDGFFGPGTGTFWAMALVGLLGQDLRTATAGTKAMNATSNIVALICFSSLGLVQWLPGMVMGAGQLVGAWFGSRTMMRRGVGFIRGLFLLVTGLTIARLVYTMIA